MKFASQKMFIITVRNRKASDPELSVSDACQYIDQMYRHAFAGRYTSGSLYLKVLAGHETPNEERLIALLRDRYLRTYGMDPIAVQCGANEYLFARAEPYEGYAFGSLDTHL